jgi:uncharacterized protein YkwD
MRKALAQTLQPGSRSRLALLTALGALILGFVAHGGLRDAVLPGVTGRTPPAARTTRCAAADAPSRNTRRVNKAVLCLHDVKRREHGLRNMRWNRDLSGVARRHARDMVSRHYFEHLSPGHRDHMDRIAASGYRPTVGCWTAGENLFSSTASATPRELLTAWMNSAAHRRNIMRKGWRDFGFGVVTTSPDGDPHGLTAVALFGTRSCQQVRRVDPTRPNMLRAGFPSLGTHGRRGGYARRK